MHTFVNAPAGASFLCYHRRGGGASLRFLLENLESVQRWSERVHTSMRLQTFIPYIHSFLVLCEQR